MVAESDNIAGGKAFAVIDAVEHTSFLPCVRGAHDELAILAQYPESTSISHLAVVVVPTKLPQFSGMKL